MLPSGAAAVTKPVESKRVHAIVELAGPPARSTQSATAALQMRSIASAQRSLAASVEATIPGAEVRWRYQRVLNALAVVVPADAVSRLERLPGVIGVTPSVPYRATLDASPALIGAPSTWRAGLANQGAGMKIGIIDDGIDAKSPMFDPSGFTMPAGFPRGDTRFTTAKVIVARAFTSTPPPLPAARLPFDRKRSQHATHVAGIAAGNAGVLPARLDGRPRLALSGVAPRAYIGNYRALTYPTESGVGLNGNSPEILAAIEAALRERLHRTRSRLDFLARDVAQGYHGRGDRFEPRVRRVRIAVHGTGRRGIRQRPVDPDCGLGRAGTRGDELHAAGARGDRARPEPLHPADAGAASVGKRPRHGDGRRLHAPAKGKDGSRVRSRCGTGYRGELRRVQDAGKAC